MLTRYKKAAESILEPVIKPLSKFNPNVLTLIGSIPSLLFFVAVVNHYYILALCTSVLHLFDHLDGMVARKYKKVTAFGGFLDSTLDRVGDYFLITCFAFAHIAPWETVAPLLLFSFMTSYIRSRGELANPHVSFAVGIVERTERLLIIFLTLLLYILFPKYELGSMNIVEYGLFILLVFSAVTIWQRFMFAYKNL